MTEKEKKLKSLALICDAETPYTIKLGAYEYLCDEGEEIISEMLESVYKVEGDDAQMLVEILANFKGRKDIYLLLVTYFYRGEDVALFAKLLGSYGDEKAVEILNSYVEENEVNYNEFMEIRNAIEQLGAIFHSNKEFTDDPFYKYLKGIDDEAAVKEDIEMQKVEEDNELETEIEENCNCESEECNCGCHDHKHECNCEDEEDDCECGSFHSEANCGCEDENNDDGQCGCHAHKH
ncbi:MAG: hypothetical protein PHE93_05140 [Clostridia bacterium]|nr:hypothetical protein [Clostridia bacterium]